MSILHGIMTYLLGNRNNKFWVPIKYLTDKHEADKITLECILTVHYINFRFWGNILEVMILIGFLNLLLRKVLNILSLLPPFKELSKCRKGFRFIRDKSFLESYWALKCLYNICVLLTTHKYKIHSTTKAVGKSLMALWQQTNQNPTRVQQHLSIY